MHRVVFVLLFVFLSCNQKPKQGTEPIGAQPPKPTDLKTEVINALSVLDKPFDNALYQNDINGLKLEVATFFLWANIVNRALNNDDEETIKLGRLLYEKVIAIQESEFPKIRKRYSVLIAPKLIRYNAEVEIIDQISTTLFVYSSDFLSDDDTNRERQRRNTINFYKSIQEHVKLFRFKSVSFSERRRSGTSSAYRVKALDDDEVVDYGSVPEATFTEESNN